MSQISKKKVGFSQSSSSLKNVSDKEYLEASGMNNMYESLLTSYIKVRPDDSMAFLTQHLERVKNCHHVLGCELGGLKCTRYNRMSFVHYFGEFLKGFSDDDELSVIEFQLLLDLICVNLSKKIMQESALYLNPSESKQDYLEPSSGGGEGSMRKYTLSALKDSLFFSVLFEEWLIGVGEIYREHSTLGSMDLGSLRSCLAIKLSKLSAPPDEIIDAAFEEMSSNQSRKEVTYDDFRRVLCNLRSPALHTYVNRTIYHAVPISSGGYLPISTASGTGMSGGSGSAGTGPGQNQPGLSASTSWGSIAGGGGLGGVALAGSSSGGGGGGMGGGMSSNTNISTPELSAGAVSSSSASSGYTSPRSSRSKDQVNL